MKKGKNWAILELNNVIHGRSKKKASIINSLIRKKRIFGLKRVVKNKIIIII